MGLSAVAVLGAAAGAAAAVEVAAEARRWRLGVLVFKPMAIGCLLGCALAAFGPPTGFRALMAAGLACSMAGDALLLFPGRLFAPGLAAFLAAQGLYTAALALMPGSPAGWALALGWGLLAGYGALLCAALWRGLGGLRPAVALYVAVIAAMAGLALARLLSLPSAATALAAAGALLFVASDSLLAWGRFRRGRPWMDPALMALYWLAQGLLVAGALAW